MGEEVGKGSDGEKKKAEVGGNKKKAEGGDKKKDHGGEKKKDDGPVTVVLKVDIHCVGCARKLKRSVKRFEGVDAVSADFPNGKLTVVGNLDPSKLRDRVESKTKSKVVLVSPTNLPKKDAPAKEEKKPPEEKKPDDKKKADDKKPKEPAVSTVVLKVRLHCEGCIQRIRKCTRKIKGVETVSIDPKEDLVTVKGTMDVKTLPNYLKERMKRSVVVVPPKKDEGGDNKKEKADKKKGGGDGDAEKKGKEGDKKKDDGGAAAKVAQEGNRMEYGYGVFPGYPPYGYRFELVPAPQLFSDENPNACSIM